MPTALDRVKRWSKQPCRTAIPTRRSSSDWVQCFSSEKSYYLRATPEAFRLISRIVRRVMSRVLRESVKEGFVRCNDQELGTLRLSSRNAMQVIVWTILLSNYPRSFSDFLCQSDVCYIPRWLDNSLTKRIDHPAPRELSRPLPGQTKRPSSLHVSFHWNCGIFLPSWEPSLTY